jgi:hypothetical protein
LWCRDLLSPPSREKSLSWYHLSSYVASHSGKKSIPIFPNT